MKNRLLPLIAALSASLLAAVGPAHAGAVVNALQDTSSASASMLVNNLLGASSGLSVVAGSAQYSGAASASGTFTAGGTSASGLGIASGVVLSTGDARFIGSSAAFAGDSANKSGTFTAGFGNDLTANTAGGNALFNSLAPFGNTNASVLSFSFVPTQGTLTMSLVFGSEDYNSLVNSGFPTDVFGVFVNGVNYAMVPGTMTPISASSINCGGPTSGPANGAGASNCGLYRDNAPFSDTIDTELNGLTVVLGLSIPVNVGATNTIAIGIADSLDDAGDSALMLRAGSVAAVPEPATLALSLAGLLTVGTLARRRRAG